MQSCPLVSVIIPTYNRAALVGRAIDSVRQQTYPHIEIVVVDDGSTDHTPAVLSQYGDAITVVRHDNQGPAISRNRGIAVARGEIIAFLDSDDSWAPTKLARQVELLRQAGPDVPCCLCDCEFVYSDGARTTAFRIADTLPPHSTGLWLNPAEVLVTRFVLFNQVVAIRREALERAGCFNENLRLNEDYELAIRLALEGPWAIIRAGLAVYNAATPGSLAAQARGEEVRLYQNLLQIRKEICALIEGEPRHARLGRLARRELRRAERQLFVARLARRQFTGAASLASLLNFIERMSRALFRRSPLYPKMIVQPLS